MVGDLFKREDMAGRLCVDLLVVEDLRCWKTGVCRSTAVFCFFGVCRFVDLEMKCEK